MPFLPKGAANACLKRARNFLDLSDKKKLPVNRVKNDLRRMALVLAVSAVDCYMHGIVIRRIGDVRRLGDLPKRLAQLEMPFSEIAALADASIAAQRMRRKARPWVQVKSSLQRKLLTMTFQSYEKVGTAFAIAGIKKPWASIGAELQISPNEIKHRIELLVHRRNQITHEGDMKRASRPRRLQFNDVDATAIRKDIEWVELLIAAMDKVVTEQTKTT